MWNVNAQLCHMEDRIGVLKPDAYGDVVISNIDPLNDLIAFAEHETSLSHVVQHGQIVVDQSND